MDLIIVIVIIIIIIIIIIMCLLSNFAFMYFLKMVPFVSKHVAITHKY